MQATPATTSLICSSPLPNSRHSLAAPSPTRLSRTLLPSSASHFQFKPLHIYLRAITPLRSTVIEEVVETAESESGLVEVGYVSSAHGLQGEVYVKPRTDFPELRFSKPGTRWLRQAIMGQTRIQEVDLVEGRGHPGQKSWILRFQGIDTVDEARQLVGSTLLVREDDRPELDEGEFYTRDLVGMRVILKATGEHIGTVVNVFDSGGNDLLHVMLNPSVATPNGNAKSNSSESESSALIWIPFVEEIVPDVDINKGEMWITPPKGLLELNLHSDERSKKERRQLEWKERKKMQRRLIAAKKKLCEMEQKHVFDGLRYGEKSQRSLLADEIVGVNSTLLQQALQNIEITSKRWNAAELISAAGTKLIKTTLRISKDSLNTCASKETEEFKLQKQGTDLLSNGKTAIVLVVNDVEKNGRSDDSDLDNHESSEDTMFSFLQKSFSNQTFTKIEDRESVPLVLVCPTQETESIRELFLNNDYFGFDSSKVWFLEEEKLPVVSSSMEEQKRHKILMKSAWEILQTPVGSGGVISLLASKNIPENLGDMGVEYIEVCCTRQKYAAGNSLLIGFTKTSRAEVGIQIFENTEDLEESFDIVFSMNLMKKLTKRIDELQFSATPKSHSHLELVGKEWVEIVPSSTNSYELHSSIYSCLSACSPEKICVLEIAE